MGSRSGAELNYGRRKADYPAASSSRVRGRSAYDAYAPTWRVPEVAVPVRDEADYHPVAPLKTLTPAEIRAIFLVVFVVTAVALGIIMLSAQATVAQLEINDLKKNIAQVDDDIANLKVEIGQAQNMQNIKDRAQDELGLKEPDFDQYVYISELPEAAQDFGKYLKERAYAEAWAGAEEQEMEDANDQETP